MRDATLCLLLRHESPARILLGYKKTGFGAGKYNGFGGKLEPGESAEAAAVRELYEETGIAVTEKCLHAVGRLQFYFPARPEWDQLVHVFLIEPWSGDPVEGTEMKPVWFTLDQIPYDQMWQDDRHWMPPILAGKRLEATFTFAEDNETLTEFDIREIPG